MSYKAGFLIVMALILSLGVACGGTGGGESLGLVPQGAEMVGHIGVGELLGNSDLIALYDALPKDADDPQTVDAALGDFREETGIDLRSFDELLIFGDLATGLDEVEYAGVIGTGVFDTARFLSDIEEAADLDFTQTTRGEYEIFADAAADAAVAFLDEGTIVMGTVDAVTDVIDVKAGDAPAIGGDVSDIFGGLGNVLAKLAATAEEVVTEDALDGATGALPVPVDLSPLIDIETTGVTFTSDDESITAQITISFASADSAKDAKALVSLAKAMVNTYGVPEADIGGTRIPEEGWDLIPRVLAELETEVADSDLIITLTMTFEEIERMLEEPATD